MNSFMYSRPATYFAALLLLVYPTLMLTVRGGMNGVFIFALLAALLAWPFTMNGVTTLYKRKLVYAYGAAMAGLTLAIFVSQIHWQSYSGHAHDAASRYWLALPIFFWLSQMGPRIFHALQYAFPVAAITGFLLTDEVWGRSGIGTLDLIHFGDAELLLGVLSAFSVDWFRKDRNWERILKFAGLLTGLAASFASGSRGGWLAIPVFIAIFVYFHRHHFSLRTQFALVGVTIVSAFVLYAANGTINQRMKELVNDVQSYQAGHRDTSIGIRWQLYTAALDIYSRHPLVGVGPSGFANEMQPMMEAGMLTAEAAQLGKGEVHNDILSKTAGMGTLGLIAILALYLVPLAMFRIASKSPVREVRRAGILGITFVCGIATFGLTVEFLNLTLAAAFYAFTVAALLAACVSMSRDGEKSKLSRDTE